MFNFRLQPVLDYRKQVEETSLSELAGIKKRLDGEISLLKELQKKRQSLISRLKEIGKNKFHPEDVSVYLSYISHVKDQERYQEKVIAEVERELEAKRLELIEAMKQRKMLEIIREDRLKEYRSHINEKERKELDELGTLRFDKGVNIEETDNFM